MGLGCKPFGKFRGALKRIDNEFQRIKSEKVKSEKKKDERKN